MTIPKYCQRNPEQVRKEVKVNFIEELLQEGKRYLTIEQVARQGLGWGVWSQEASWIVGRSVGEELLKGNMRDEAGGL